MNSQTDAADDDADRALAEEGRAVRDFIKSNRSNTLLCLFDFLLQQSLEGRRPKETDIAEQVFQESHEWANSQGSRVRVGVHRLRKKLDLYYADKPGARIVIPQGEYGLLLKSSDDLDDDEEAPPAEADTGTRRKIGLWVAAVALVLGNVTLAGLYFKDRMGFGDNTVRSTLWRGFDTKVPTKIVVGDYFMFLSKDDGSDVYHPTQDLSIYNADGFYARVSGETGSTDRFMEGNPYTVSVDTLAAASDLWPILTRYKPQPVTASDVNAEIMKSSNIIYVGALDALSPLIGNPLFQASQFRCADTCYELVDKKSGRHFLSASPYLLGDQIIPRHDYGYIASFPGPSGKRILVISGTGDAGVRQMVGLAMDPRRLQQLSRRIGGDFSSFEALFQVRTMFSQNYQSSLLIAHPINTAKVWDKTNPMNWHPAPPFIP
ncbi:MAG: hypothetical protein KKD64_02345 [Alphaproteobacteria bacterium]|nr:hypothetical protein [Alphaproteobacteria bacterium]MBU0794556.1 hypothetical protein [Alphaproteobacteria bacterium]MBU0877052.1 hypothetical protein [Alphaproteobacteria bacterium]MBU1768478.1 hypothetical protein [Alphaproteobacteria bacterium]